MCIPSYSPSAKRELKVLRFSQRRLRKVKRKPLNPGIKLKSEITFSKK